MYVCMSYQRAPVPGMKAGEKTSTARIHAERGVKLEISQTLPYASTPPGERARCKAFV